jgi:hypothetical protein
MAALFVGVLLIYLQYRAESVRRVETLASMVLRQAHEDVQAGHPNEAAARLAEAVRLHREGLAAPARLQALLRETSHLARVPAQSHRIAKGKLLDAVYQSERHKPLLAIRDEKGLTIYDGSSGAALAMLGFPATDENVRVRLSPHMDRIAIWRTTPATDGQGIEAATYRFGSNNGLKLEAQLPAGVGDVCFLKDGTLLAGDDKFVRILSLADQITPATWKENSASQLNVSAQRISVSPSEKYVFIVTEGGDNSGSEDEVFCLDRNTLQALGRGAIKSNYGNKVYGLDSRSTDLSESLAIVWDGKHRNKQRGGHASLFTVGPEGWTKMTLELSSTEGINDVALLRGDRPAIATDNSRVRIATETWDPDLKSMDIISTGSIQRVMASPDGDIWVVKAPMPESSWNLDRPFGMISCERWQPALPATITVSTITSLPQEFPPAVSERDDAKGGTLPIEFVLPPQSRKLTLAGRQLLIDGKPEPAVDYDLFSPHQPRCMAASLNGRFLVIAGGEDPRNDEAGFAMVWQTSPFRAVSQVLKHRGCVRVACISEDGRMLATLSRSSPPLDGPLTELTLWDVGTGLPLGQPIPLKSLVAIPADDLIFEARLCFAEDLHSLFLKAFLSEDPKQPPTIVRFRYAPDDKAEGLDHLRSEATKSAGVQLTERGSIVPVKDSY